MDGLKTIGAVSLADFMRRHWQRRPLLARQAIPGFASPIGPEGVAALAARDDVESRLIDSTGDRWSLEHGPFERLPSKRRRWTLLVQGVDLHDDAVHALLQRFRFLPDARLDDLMVSYATNGGGVGPHVDSYDVFLLQAHGRRRWQVAPPGDATLQPGLPVKRLANFQPTEEWVLEPGDMLYLPPGWQHDGVALGECMTFSIGFRAPSRHEFLSAWLAAAGDAPGGPDPRFGDRGRTASARPGELPADLLETLRGWAQGWRPTTRDIDRFIGCFVTEPKPQVWFETPVPMPLPRFASAASRAGVVVDRRTRIAWRGPWLFVNGESHEVPSAGRAALRRLADHRHLDGDACRSTLDDAVVATLLHQWYGAGWIRLGAPRR
jgi:50S ribosomal protein L16 3-hydroxylase